MSIADKLTAIAENQQKVYAAGFAAGQAQGGYAEGYEQGYEEGKGSVQDNAQYASVIRCNGVAFPDGYEMKLKLNNALEVVQLQNTTGIRKVELDMPTDKTYSANNMLYNAKSIEEVVLPDGIKFSAAGYFATNVTTLVSVFGRMDVSGITTANLFIGCTNLVDVSFMPLTITHNKSFNKSYKLSEASIQSIIDGLADLTGQTTQTLTLHADVGAKLTDEQKASATAKNWTLAY